MRISDGVLEEVLYCIHRAFPDLGIKNALNAYHEVKNYKHDLRIKSDQVYFTSSNLSDKHSLILESRGEKIQFIEVKDEHYEVRLFDKGDLAKSVVETCAYYEMQNVEKELYLLYDDGIYFAEPHSRGYLIKSVEKESDAMKYLSSSKMYSLYAGSPHKEFEDKLVLLVGDAIEN